MNTSIERIFGFISTPEFEEALDKTFERFEAMPGKELFALAREHQFKKEFENFDKIEVNDE